MKEYNEAQRKELAKKAMDVVVESHNKKQDVVISLTNDGKKFNVYYSTLPSIVAGTVLVPEASSPPSPVKCPPEEVWSEALQKCVPSNPDMVELKIGAMQHAADYDEQTNINALFDGLIETRFSVESPGIGIPKFVLLIDLGGVQEIHDLGMSYYKGTERKYFLEAQVSDDPNNFNYTQQIESSGATNELEWHPMGLKPINGRFIRILGKGNSENEWNAYTTLKVRGKQLVDVPEKPTPAPEPDGENDKNGIKKFYPTDTSKPSWYLGDKDVNTDPELEIDGDKGKDSKAKMNEDPTLKKFYTVKSREGGLASGGTQLTLRLHVIPLASKGVQKVGNKDKYHEEIKAQGHIIAAQDLKNIEQTAIVRLRGITKEKGRISHKQHGGIHTGSDDPRASCLGMVIQFKDSDKRLAELELFHPDYQFFETAKLIAGLNNKTLENQWIGTKCISLVEGDNVHEILMVNTNPFDEKGQILNNNWTPYADFTFKKGVKDTDNKPIEITPTWGAMVTTWRINEVTEVDIYSLSVRSILGQ
jgi:hypothetical protein